MINVEEHKKLLAQIAELEKGSTNFFDVEKEFFLIDSDNLQEVRTRFYGYSIQRTGIYEEDNLTAEAIANLDGRGCYVYVEAKDGQITIKQDLNGCWGIYLFRHGDYFALSNSFFRLLDHVKFKYPLTVNRDYCHYLMFGFMCSFAYLETAVNEIKVTDRSALFHIDIAKKNLQIEFTDCTGHNVELESEEGIGILDDWFDFWRNLLHNVSKNTKFVMADLSGGFDSRISFVPLLNADIDLNDMRIYSRKSVLHTFKEDYEIASKMAEHYGFELNRDLLEPQTIDYTLTDSCNIELYHQRTFRNLARVTMKKKLEKVYYLKGVGGESIRPYWYGVPNEFAKRHKNSANRYSVGLAREVSDSVENVLRRSFDAICNKYKIEDRESPEIPQYLYQEAPAINHHGKEKVGSYFVNTILLDPVFDPTLRKLRLNSQECPDPNLLTALIFVRYQSDLLTFPFNGNHKISLETIEYAKKINERFPRPLLPTSDEKAFNLLPRDSRVEKILAEGRNNKAIPAGLPERSLKAMFESSKTYGLFTSYFDAEIYHYVAKYYENNVFGRNRPMYAVLGVTRVIEDVEISRRNRLSYDGMKHLLEEDFTTIYKDTQIPDKFQHFIAARIDIRLMSNTGEFQINSISDRKATIYKPGWLPKDTIGYTIGSLAGKIEFVAKSSVDGKIQLYLIGRYVPNPEDKTKLIPYWIDYTKLIVNGATVFDTLTPAWHNQPYRHDIDAKAGEEIKIQVEWLPHRSDT